MKKYIVAIAFSLVLGAKLQAATGGLIAGSEADFYSNTIGTGTSIFVGAGVIDQICVSSGNGTAFMVPYDTGSINRTVYADLTASTLTVIPAMLFSSGTVVNTGAQVNMNTTCNVLGWGRGVRVQNGLFIFQSSANSGESNKTTIYWRRD